jgi:hypothetical protein
MQPDTTDIVTLRLNRADCDDLRALVNQHDPSARLQFVMEDSEVPNEQEVVADQFVVGSNPKTVSISVDGITFTLSHERANVLAATIRDAVMQWKED